MSEQGMMLFVMRRTLGDCTNNGVSARYDKLLLVGPHVPKIHGAGKMPIARLQKGPMDSIRLVPDECGTRWTMFGGNIATTSDSRFREVLQATFNLTEREIENLLGNALDSDESGESEEKVSRHTTFQEAGLLTRNKGLVLRCRDGSEFQITIVKSN